jgi:polyisoprenoid-binding protein YceI
MSRFREVFVTMGMAAATLGCASEEAESSGPAVTPIEQEVAVATEERPEAAAVFLTIAADGNEARYRVRERLVGFELPNDAVGATGEVTGSVGLERNGRVIPEASIIRVDLTGLRSDEERRDGFLQRRTLETSEHPEAVLRPTEIRGLPLPLPTSGTRSFELLGDLTIRGVTQPTTWDIAANFEGGIVSGAARTAFTFEDFALAKPRVPAVLSVADTIRLEYDFRMVTTD